MKKFKEALAAVREGREKYMQEALKIRMGAMVENSDQVVDDVESDDNCVLDESDLWDHIVL